MQLIGSNKEREVFTYKYTVLDIFYDCEHSLKYDMLRVDVGQGRQRNGLCFLTSEINYIVMDHPTWLSFPFPLMLAKFIAISRDTTCASKYP